MQTFLGTHPHVFVGGEQSLHELVDSDVAQDWVWKRGGRGHRSLVHASSQFLTSKVPKIKTAGTVLRGCHYLLAFFTSFCCLSSADGECWASGVELVGTWFVIWLSGNIMVHFAPVAGQPGAEEGESCWLAGTCVNNRFCARIPALWDGLICVDSNFL